MNTRMILSGLCILLYCMPAPSMIPAQTRDIVIPLNADISVARGAEISADRIFANNPGYGTLTLAHASGVCPGAVIVPVELLTLSAAMQDGMVLLSWITATETRNYGFDVQRKTEGGGWSTLGFVEGHGSTVRQHVYMFTDPLRNLATYCCRLRYRLKQIDLDGSIDYSPEVEVRLDQPMPVFSLRGFPSPCNELLTVHLGLSTTGPTSIRLHDVAGRAVMVIAQNAMLQAGNHSMPIRTEALPAGLYLLVAESRDGRRTEKVMIRH